MKLESSDWRKLQYPLLALGAALVVSSLLGKYSEDMEEAAQLALQQQQSALQQASQRYQQSGGEREAIIHYLPRYQQLISQGFVGEERRIDWVDALRTIGRQHKLFAIKYSLGAQENYKPAFKLDASGFTLHRSIMKIEAPLLHEGDLLTLTEALATQGLSPYLLRDCVMTRQSTVFRDKFAPNLNLNCQLDWLTLSEPAKSGVSP